MRCPFRSQLRDLASEKFLPRQALGCRLHSQKYVLCLLTGALLRPLLDGRLVTILWHPGMKDGKVLLVQLHKIGFRNMELCEAMTNFSLGRLGTVVEAAQ